MLRKAIEWNMVEENIIKRLSNIKPLKNNNKRLRYLTKEEINKLLSVCDKYLYPIVFTALNTGMRREEILSLRWNNVDLRNGYIYVEISKNGESRTIPMNDTLLSIFRKLFTERRIDTNYVFVNPLTGTRLTDIKRRVVSTFLCKFFIERQIRMHLTYFCMSPAHLHF
jgi:integrase